MQGMMYARIYLTVAMWLNIHQETTHTTRCNNQKFSKGQVYIHIDLTRHSTCSSYEGKEITIHSIKARHPNRMHACSDTKAE